MQYTSLPWKLCLDRALGLVILEAEKTAKACFSHKYLLSVSCGVQSLRYNSKHEDSGYCSLATNRLETEEESTK
jgi:hypothetical protein